MVTPLSMLWLDRCTVYVYSKISDSDTKRTEFQETVLFDGEPCKLSFENLSPTGESGHVATKAQSVKLFLDNSVLIPAGSKVVVSRGSNTYTYKSSGEPGVFSQHQEVNLELFRGWA